MKKLIIILLLHSSAVFANPNLINLELQNAKLHEVIKMFLSSVMDREYILSPDLSADNTPINISIKNKTKQQAIQIFDLILSENNIVRNEVGGIFYVKKRTKNNLEFDEHQSVIESDTKDVSMLPTSLDPIINNDVPNLYLTPSDVTIYKPANIQPEELIKLLRFANIRAEVSAGHVIYEPKGVNEEFIKQLLKEFDGYNSDVVIKATVLEFQQSDKTQTAIQAALNIIKNTVSLSTTAINFNATKLVLNLPNLNAIIANISSNDNFRVLSSPSIRVSHNKKSSINVGNEVPVLTSLTQTNQGQPLQNVEYRSSGITLEVTPQIYSDMIQIDLVQSISDFLPTTNGVNSTPTLSQRRIETSLKLKNGETILIGGLNQTRDDSSKTSFFGIPTGKTTGQQQTDLLLILHVEKV